MKKIMVIMDSFKDTIDFFDIIEIGKKAAMSIFGNTDCVEFYPMADGGENTALAISYILDGSKIIADVHNASMKKISATYCIDNNNNAYIDVASVVGFNSNKDEKRDIKKASSYGVGELIKHAIDNNCNKIYLGLGGTLTNDVACGALASLGIKFYNIKDEEVFPTPFNFFDIKKIETPYNKEYGKVKLICLCDVTNPLYGENGATHIFAKQKGATAEDVEFLEESVKYISSILNVDNKIDPFKKGMGAAGGMMYGLNVLFDIETLSGAEFLLSLINFDKNVDSNTVVVTGEGKLDSQSFQGKVIGTISNRANLVGANVYGIVGTTKLNENEILKNGISKVWRLNDGSLPISELRKNVKNELYEAFIQAFIYVKNNEL